MKDQNWYQKSVSEALKDHDTKLDTGLSTEEVQLRRSKVGPNLIKESGRKSAFKILLHQFANALVVVLVAAAIIAGFLGEAEEVIAIVAIIVLNGVLGFIQEFRAEKAMEALKSLAAPQAKVRRMGQTQLVPAQDLVPGDIVHLEAGALVPADIRVLEAAEVRVDESVLTGESLAVTKHTAAVSSVNVPVGDQKNMAFKGTLLVAGRGVGLVTATGMSTELGKIAKLLHEEVEVNTPLQRRLESFARQMALVVLGLCVVIFLVGIVRGEAPGLMFLTALSLAVAAIPEALPAVVTVSLAIGARIMSSRNALIRKLPAVEALGAVTYICTDKTGTLTKNRMAVGGYFVNDDVTKAELLKIMALNNDVNVGNDGSVHGDPTEVALFQAAFDAGIKKPELEAMFPRIDEIPFSSERSMMSTVHNVQGRHVVYVKGAPEQVFARCRWQYSASQSFDVSVARKASDALAEQGMRVLAFANRDGKASDSYETDLTFMGLVGLIDPPRSEAKEAIALCKSAGIHVVMITGDHPSTAMAIARTLEIVTEGTDQTVITGPLLEQMSDKDLELRVRDVRVYARVAPEQKIRIVKALQTVGEVASMTGDGVNDAPALRRADVGVSMGKNGTDVAREASHMILLDDNFATIVAAVREGRRIYDNIRKFVRFALSGNSGEIWTLFIAPFVGLPTPLLPIHILWVNLVTDGLPGLALALEGEERNLMRRRPRSPTESIFARGLWQHALWVGLLTAAATLTPMAWAYHTGHAHWQSMAFTVLTCVQMGHVLAIRSERDSVFTLGLFSNLPLLGTVILTFALQMATLYVPALNRIFKTEPLTLEELAVCVLCSTTVFIAVEFEKWFLRRKKEEGPVAV